MNFQPFLLQPFSPTTSLPGLKIFGNITHDSGDLFVSYTLSGPIDQIMIPVAEKIPNRKNRLWENTCFELFLRVKNSDPYREFNLSPSGNWNVYRFDAYRKNMAEETAFSALPFCVSRQTDTLCIDVKFNLKKIIPPDLPAQAAVSAVIKSVNKGTSFWALSHPGPKPDFHHPDSFILEL